MDLTTAEKEIVLQLLRANREENLRLAVWCKHVTSRDADDPTSSDYKAWANVNDKIISKLEAEWFVEEEVITKTTRKVFK